MDTIYVEGDNPRPANDTEQTAINILRAAIARIKNSPVIEDCEYITNNGDAMLMADQAVHTAMRA